MLPIVEVEGLTWRYDAGQAPALDQVALTIEPGRCVAVMGPTGSGKSSLALALRGIIPSFFESGQISGTIVISGVDVIHSDPQLICDRVGLVFQDPSSQVFGSTVLADVSFGLANLGIPQDELRERAWRYLEWTRLRDKHWRNSGMLSGGEAQRLALAAVLAMEPAVLVLDEPAGELDPVGRRELFELLERLRLEGRTIILIEQDPETVLALADWVMVMDKGRVAIADEPHRVFERIAELDEIGVSAPETARLARLLIDRLGLGTRPALLSIEDIRHWLLELVDGRTADRAAPLADANQSALDQGDIVMEVRGLEHVYNDPSGDITALRGVDLDIRAGEYLAILGPNGAGKTTLTKHLNGLLPATSGTVRFQGVDLRRTTLSQMARHVGYCFQNPDHQIFERTVFDEVAFGLRNLGIAPADIASRTDSILERFGLAALARAHPLNLGRGERQKVALASIVVLEPEVLVIDEPTTGLDWRESMAILDLLGELNAKGTTLVVVTHDMRLVRERARRCVVMADGTILFDGSPAELFARSDVCTAASLAPPALVTLYAALREAQPTLDLPFPRTVEELANSLASAIGGDR